MVYGLVILADAATDSHGSLETHFNTAINLAMLLVFIHQTRVFMRGNQIAERQAGMLQYSRQGWFARYRPILIMLALLLFGWSLELYNTAFTGYSVLIVVCLSLIATPLSFAAMWRTISNSLRKFNPNDIDYAEWGATKDGVYYSVHEALQGKNLPLNLIPLFGQSPAQKLLCETIGTPDPVDGPHKQLKFKLRSGKCFSLDEYNMVTFDSAIPIEEFQPSETKIYSPYPPEPAWPFVGKTEELIHHVSLSDPSIKMVNGAYELSEKQNITTNEQFSPTVAFRLLAKISLYELRFGYLQPEMIFNHGTHYKDFRVGEHDGNINPNLPFDGEHEEL